MLVLENKNRQKRPPKINIINDIVKYKTQVYGSGHPSHRFKPEGIAHD
jgi:hypothetical protein